MKVILAGFSKTGTISMRAALTELGFKTYGYLDHEYYHNKEWMEILTTGGSTELFRKMYENVDAVVGRPVFCFWKEIHQAFPDAKLVLTMRDEEEWLKSCMRHVRSLNDSWMYLLERLISPTGRRCAKVAKLEDSMAYGGNAPFNWSHPYPGSKTMFRIKYRQHNTDVLQNAPEDKLLIFRVKEGWGPLCKFLQVPVPPTPFPCKNINCSLLKEAAEENHIKKKIQFETKLILCVLVLFATILVSWVITLKTGL